MAIHNKWKRYKGFPGMDWMNDSLFRMVDWMNSGS